MNDKFPRGSEWRKWDLQIQTVLDDDYRSLDQYYKEIKQGDPALWDEYVSKVGGEANALLFDSKSHFADQKKDKKERCVDYARNLVAFIETFSPDLECIGVTDHNYFDDLLLDVLVEYSTKSRLKIIPGVEINCQGIHMLLFFPDKLYGKDTFSAGIQALLIKFDIDNPKTGGVLTTTPWNIKDIIDEVKRGGGIIIYPHCNSGNGLFQERTRTDRTHLADIFNHQKVNLLQSQHQKSSAEVAEYINSKAKNLKSKFCTHISSDARALRDIGRADEDGNFLWIKANPNFEGLKQIVYEPEQRIFVGSQKPGEKKPYFVVDKVRFLDNTGKICFGSDAIEVNQNLTTIVGGKSTGKSLLLYYMAKTINNAEVEARTLNNDLAITYDFDSSPDFNFEVSWKDGQRTLLKMVEGAVAEEIKQRKILYIPQRYLNTLSESKIESREALNAFVLDVILQDLKIKEKYEGTVREIRAATKTIPTAIGELFSDKEDIRKTEEEIKQAGDEAGVETYIKTLQVQVDTIKAKSGLTDEQLKKYSELSGKEKTIGTEISNLQEDRKTIEKLQADLKAKAEGIHATADEYEGYLNDDDVKVKFKTAFGALESVDAVLKTAISNVTAVIDKKEAGLKQDLASIKKELAPLLAKVRLQKELQEKTAAIQKEQKKINEIAIKKKSLKTKRAALRKKADAIIESYRQITAKYENLRIEFKTFENRFGDIALSVLVGFNEDSFNSAVIREYLNRRELKKVVADVDWGDEAAYKYDPQKHLANITLAFEGLLAGSINTVKSRSVRDAVEKLFGNYFYLDFKIFYKGDSLDKMSPGKKGLVLLKLLINLSNEEWPILLDQPEDDLDNRSVYDDLVVFLKEKKLQRQIIIVTHNPNLVVGADAEEVVVANQSGQEVGRENRKYKFEYVSGALEDTFEMSEKQEPAILYRKGVRQHVCEILEGGKEAFQKREQKYSFPE